MATNFPTSIDDFTDYVDGTTILEAVTLNNMQKAIEALEAKVGIDDSVVTASHDYKIDHIGGDYSWAHDGTKVFDGINPTSYSALSLNSIIGSKYALCLLKVVKTTYDSVRYLFRSDLVDSEYDNYNYVPYDGGCSVLYLPSDNSDLIGYVLVSTNSYGGFYWKGVGNQETTKIYLQGYVTT